MPVLGLRMKIQGWAGCSPCPPEAPSQAGEKASEQTICMQWERMLQWHTTSWGSGQWGRWVRTEARSSPLPFWHWAHTANTPQAIKKRVARTCYAQLRQATQVLAACWVPKHHQLMQLFQDNRQSLEQDAQEENIKTHTPLTQKRWELREPRMRRAGLDRPACWYSDLLKYTLFLKDRVMFHLENRAKRITRLSHDLQPQMSKLRLSGLCFH